MATESEVTFIRCPSCRSLIPASSARCRMCGVSLEGSGAKAEEPAKPQGRVRQQTSSIPAADVSVTDPKQAASAGKLEESDPLEELLKELENEEAEDESEEDLFDDEDDQDDFEEDDEDDIEESNSDDIKNKKVSDEADPLADFFEEDEEPSKKSKSTVKGKPRLYKGFAKRFVAKSKEDRVARKNVSKKENSIEKPMQPRVIQAESIKEDAAEVKKAEIVKVPELMNKVSEKIEPSTNGTSHETVKEVEVLALQEEKKPESNTGGWVRKATKEMSPIEVAKLVGGKADKTTVQGRLFGWFVNYAVPEGQAIELREGRFFISGSKLKPTDIVIADGSVSTPHALVIVSSQGGLIVQDLMSERGVFKRDTKDSAYKREHDPVALQHGDWIRFGDVEFTVAIIPHIGSVQPE